MVTIEEHDKLKMENFELHLKLEDKEVELFNLKLKQNDK
jgi:hypothetical protein